MAAVRDYQLLVSWNRIGFLLFFDHLLTQQKIRQQQVAHSTDKMTMYAGVEGIIQIEYSNPFLTAA